MAYRPASAVPCVAGYVYHSWSAIVAWGLHWPRIAERQACVRCGCERVRVVDVVNPRKGRGWTYREGVIAGAERSAGERG